MKILLITHFLPYPPRGGCNQRGFNLIKQTAKHHELHLVTFYRKSHLQQSEHLDESIEAMRQYCREVHVFPLPGDHSRLRYFTILILNLFSSDPYSAALYRSPSLQRKVLEMLGKHDYDIVEIGEIGLLNYARLAPGIPKLLVHQNIESQLLYRRAEVASNPLSRLYIRLQAYRTARFEHRAANLIERHTVCSDIDKTTIEKINPNINAIVVSNGVDTEFFKSTGEEVEPNSLIFVGGLTWLPNRDAMLFFKNDIWPLLKKKLTEIKITVVGSNPPAELMALAKTDKNFVVTGFVEDIRSLVSRAAVYVVPIRVGGGTRLKILDAMSMSKAIVSHPIGAEGIAVTEGKDIAIAETAESFADTIIDLLDNPDKRIEIETNARRTVENLYDWSRIASVLLHTYAELATLKSRQ